MAKKVLLVGHCGPDSSHLRMAIKRAVPDVEIVAADDSGELSKRLVGGVDLILLNRELGYGFDPDTGVEVLKVLRGSGDATPAIVVSNYADAQQAALAAGALAGFGKRDIGSQKVTAILRDALGIGAAANA